MQPTLLDVAALLKQAELQMGRLGAALEKMLTMYPASTFCEVDCRNGSCEHCQLEADVRKVLSL